MHINSSVSISCDLVCGIPVCGRFLLTHFFPISTGSKACEDAGECVWYYLYSDLFNSFFNKIVCIRCWCDITTGFGYYGERANYFSSFCPPQMSSWPWLCRQRECHDWRQKLVSSPPCTLIHPRLSLVTKYVVYLFVDDSCSHISFPSAPEVKHVKTLVSVYGITSTQICSTPSLTKSYAYDAGAT